RTIFSVYGESSAYGKMTKWLDAYVKNIVFKEAIPPLARTHDHWEAMHLKTGLVISYPHLKSKNLIENTPPNYFSFLKRLEGWLGGDMLLLEYETYFGVFLDFLRIIFSFLSMNISEGKYWINHLSKRMNYLREKSDTPSHLSKKLRIWLIKRLSFSPFYYGLWLFLVGTVSLIIPGTLTIRAPQLAWCIFWSVLFILICLPKLIIPLLERLLLFERRKTKLFIFILTVLFSFLINKWGREILPDWNKICLYLLGIYLAFPLIFHALGIIFTFKPGMTRRLGNFLILLILGFYLWLYMPFLINWLANIPSARWIFSFSLQFIPSALGFLLPFLFLSKIIPSPRISLELIKRGLLETIYSSSILLLNIIHIPLIVFSKMYFIIFNPHKTIPWITSPFIEKILGKRISLLDTYLRLIWAPLFSFSLTLLPVALGWADPSLLFYGWPIFIWSWILGPLLVWYSGNYGESQTFSSLTFLGIRDIISLHKKEFLNQNLSCNQAKLIEIILEYNLKLNHSLSQRELLRLFLYFITDIKYEESSLKKLRERYLPAEISPENLREYNWETLNELGRARIFRKVYRNSLPRETKIIQVISVLVNLMGPKRWGLPAWEELPSSQQEKLLRKIFKRYVVSYEEERAIKKLLQLFGKKELKRLSLKIKKIKELKEIISLIPAEFFYLRKAIKDMENLSSLHLNPFQKKIFLNLLITRYNLKEKNQVSIINHILNLLPSSPSAKERQK
ncbi:MAG: hypothetical protein NC821_04620, partial [Candidatus Omnitrophica bacterium]|nr:hypothetical protein [Candidatus Omnitrophota bacterium]